MRASTAPMTVLVLTLVSVLTTVAMAAPPPPPPPGAEVSGPTPPRLSYVYEDVSFWRPGAADWAPAQLNTPLAPGDELYTSERGNVELQVGTRAFVRAAGSTQVGILNQDSDFLQLKVTTGHLAIDLRTGDPGR